MTPTLIGFIMAVVAAGVAVIAHSVATLHLASLSPYALLLSGLTIAAGRLSIKIPGRPATVSVSEVFVFASILLFGPAVPALTVAVDGLWTSITQKNRRLHRAVFNIAEPAISTWAAAQVFFAIMRTSPGVTLPTTPMVVPATVAMAAVFLVLNSGLSAVAVALESRTSVLQFWRGHAWYLGVNYYAAASLAALAVSSGRGINFAVVGLAAPLLLLSYVAYREAANRIVEARQHSSGLERLYRSSVDMLAIAVDAKDQVTHGHIHRVQRYTLRVAAGLGVTDPLQLKAIEAGALLHDIGKLAVPDYVLNKPSALTSAEFEVMKKHASMGARILTAVDYPYPIVPIVRHHHERWDGRGYPDGLVGAEIPLGARILAVVDCFDAITSDRPYRPRMTDEQACGIMRLRRGTFYDPSVVDAFITLLPELRKDDVAAEHAVTHASLVAGLAQTTQATLTPTIADHSLTVPSAVPGVVQELIESQASRLSADVCLFEVNAAKDTLMVAHATAHIRPEITGLQMPIGSGVSGWVAANRSTIRRSEPVLDLGRLADTLGMKTCVAVPVFVREDLFGVLTVYLKAHAVADEDVSEVGLLAQEVGLMMARKWSAPFGKAFARPTIVRPPLVGAS